VYVLFSALCAYDALFGGHGMAGCSDLISFSRPHFTALPDMWNYSNGTRARSASRTFFYTLAICLLSARKILIAENYTASQVFNTPWVQRSNGFLFVKR
jgi:hypothetical protein